MLYEVITELMNIITIFLGISVGATTKAESVINVDFAKVIILGVIAFSIGTACGVLFGKIMCVATKGKVNPLIGSAGVSAVPMAARVSQKVGQETRITSYNVCYTKLLRIIDIIFHYIHAKKGFFKSPFKL